MNCTSKPTEPAWYGVVSEDAQRCGNRKSTWLSYWVSREYVMCLFNCVSEALGSAGSSVVVVKIILFFEIMKTCPY